MQGKKALGYLSQEGYFGVAFFRCRSQARGLTRLGPNCMRWELLGKEGVLYQKQYAHLPLISLDNIRHELNIKPDNRDGQGKVDHLAYERTKEFCRRKQSFVWNSTNLTTDMRARLIGALRVYDPRFTIVYIEAFPSRYFPTAQS